MRRNFSAVVAFTYRRCYNCDSASVRWQL